MSDPFLIIVIVLGLGVIAIAAVAVVTYRDVKTLEERVSALEDALQPAAAPVEAWRKNTL
jgi:hypothetical protein